MKYNDKGEPLVGFSELKEDMQNFIVDHYAYIGAQDQFFLHKKGGLYWKLYEGKLTDDASDVIIYKHLYPHEVGVWVRSKAEFEDGRFRRIYNDKKGKITW